MNKKHIVAVLAAFTTVWVTDMLIHSVWLGSAYAATKELWRPEAQMMGMMHWMLIGQFIVSAAIATIYVKAMADTATLNCALGFGACVGLIAAGSQVIMYSVAPYPGDLVMKWCVAYLLQGVIVGLVLHRVCRPKATA